MADGSALERRYDKERTVRCIYCRGDTNYKSRQRNGRRCDRCRRPFAFEPYGQSPKVTDQRFQNALRAVTGDGTLYFTRRQLWYEMNRRLDWPQQLPQGFRKGYLWLVSCFGGLPRPKLDYKRFIVHLQQWERAHGPIERLLPAKNEPVHRQPDTIEPDLTLYSFDRALIVDRTETAAMLVANNFHFENNCALLSVHGYPPDLTDTVMTMLRRNPQLQVFALHDASANGCRLPLLLRSEPWFPDPAIRIHDLGLRPRHAHTLGLLTLSGSSRERLDEVAQLLTPEEVAWLQKGNRAELATLRPARLMRAIYQGFARSTKSDANNAHIWLDDHTADFYAADSFG